jgi:CRP-like cAMP-binding protein
MERVGRLWRRGTATDADDVSDPRVDALRRIPMFAPLAPATLRVVLSRLKEVVVPAGETLFVRGESGGHFYVVVEGELEVMLESGETKVVSDYLGEIALVRGRPRTATVRARTDSRLWSLCREDFLTAVAGDPGASQAADEIVDDRLGYVPSA